MALTYIWSDHAEAEYNLIEDLSSDSEIVLTALLLGAETVKTHSKRWPAFGDSGEEIGYYIDDVSEFKNLCAMYNKQYDTIEF